MFRKFFFLIIMLVLIPAAFAADRGVWAPDVAYAVGDTVDYQGLDYKCRQAHTSHTGWEPAFAHTLWLRVASPVGEWQPWTSYNINTIVTFQDAKYRCLQSHVSQTDWEPASTPALWLIKAVPDPVLHWNAITLQADANDHSGIFGPPNQGGPTRSSRAFAIVHAAIFDAVNSIDGSRTPYLTLVPNASDAAIGPAVATAAHLTLVALYPNQKSIFDTALQNHLSLFPASPGKTEGIQVGKTVAKAILAARSNDGSNDPMPYTPSNLPGFHREDPLNPGQGFLTPRWGLVDPFVVLSGTQFRVGPHPALTSDEYTVAFNDVKSLGGDGEITPTDRTQEQTIIGIYWSYDGNPGVGTPPRLYNQIARLIALKKGNSVVQNARLFGLVNLAMGDSGITCWETKYFYEHWRPVLGIREADPGTGPTGLGDGNPDTIGDPSWTPLGAPATNRPGGNPFTPPFPAYTSGHATFGAAMLQILALFYGTDNISFTFVSDEFNGVTLDGNGAVRPRVPRSYNTLTQAAVENARSRIYLGVHWQYNADFGIKAGKNIADYVYNNALQ